MKRNLLLMVFLIFILASCSSNKKFELISVHAEVVQDVTKVGSVVVKEGGRITSVVPTSLYYEFNVKNKGWSSIGKSDKLSFKIIPSERLDDAVKRVFKKDIFVLESGYGLPALPFKKNKEGIATLYYHLGTYQGDLSILTFPSEKELEDIEKYALDSTLVISLRGEEIARYKLNVIN